MIFRNDIEKINPMQQREGANRIEFKEPVKTMWGGIKNNEFKKYVAHKAELYFEKRIRY